MMTWDNLATLDWAAIGKAVSDFLIAFGAIYITRYSWKAAESARGGNKELVNQVQRALEQQLVTALGPVNALVSTITQQTQASAAMVAPLATVPVAMEEVRTSVVELRREVSELTASFL